MGLVGGTLPAEHTEEFGIILAEEVDLLTMLLAVSLLQRAQGHGDQEGLGLLLLLAEGTEQDPAGGLGTHLGGWGETVPAEGVSTGGGHCILQGPFALRTGGPFVGGGGGHHGAFPSPSIEASVSVHMNPLSLKWSHFYESQRERNDRLREGKSGVSGQRSHLAPPLVLPRVLATTYQLSGSKLQGISNYPAFSDSGPVIQFSTPSDPSGSWGGEQSMP